MNEFPFQKCSAKVEVLFDICNIFDEKIITLSKNTFLLFLLRINLAPLHLVIYHQRYELNII